MGVTKHVARVLLQQLILIGRNIAGKQPIERRCIFPSHLTSASALLFKTGNMEIVSYT